MMAHVKFFIFSVFLCVLVDICTSETNEELVERARLAEVAQMYTEMAQFTKIIVEKNNELSELERNLLSVAYKNVMDQHRMPWQIVSSYEVDWKEKGKQDKLVITEEFKGKLKPRILSVGDEILGLLNKLIQHVKDDESKVMYNKMKGDYNRYIAEVETGEKRKIAAENSLAAYKEAYATAKSAMQPKNSNRLAVALNFSVFYHEIMNSPAEARQLAQEAITEYNKPSTSDDNTETKASTMILKLIQSNLSLWDKESQVKKSK